MKRLILGMAESKKSALFSLKSKTPELLETLMKLYMYPEHESTQHWRQEIAAFIRRAPKLKSSNKYPKEKDILKYTWYVWEDSFLDWVNKIQKSYGKLDYTLDTAKLYDSCQQYFKWLADELSKTGLVVPEEVYEKLISLGF